MRIRLFGIAAAMLVGAVSCGDDTETPADATDAPEPIDGAPDAQRATCTCCTQLPFTADSALDVASDGAATYVLFRATASSQLQLGTVSAAGGTPSVIATADDIVLSSFENTVFYALRMGADYELHQRTNAADTVLGSVTLGAGTTIKIAGNATDLYVLHMQSAATEMLRFSRSSPGAPTIVASENGAPTGLALGATVGEMQTTNGNWLVSLPGPSTPTTLPNEAFALTFSGDQGFGLRAQMQTTHASQWRIDRVIPTPATIYMSSILINGGFDELRADASHLYVRVTSGSEAPGSPTYRALMRVAPDGTGVMQVCGSWPSNVLRLDATHLLGLERVSDGQWVAVVMPKP